MNMPRMRLAIELYSTTDEEARKIARIIEEAMRGTGMTGLGVRMFEVDKEGRRIEEPID